MAFEAVSVRSYTTRASWSGGFVKLSTPVAPVLLSVNEVAWVPPSTSV